MRRRHYFFRAVGFIETDGRWGALCLETSFIGYGETFEAALVDLVDATECGLDFKRRHPDAQMGAPASPRDWKRYERAIQSRRPNAAFQVDLDRAAA